MSERRITRGSYFLTGITVSALLHVGIFYLVYVVFGSIEEEMDYALLKKTRIKNLDSFEGELNNLERQLSELMVTINDTNSLITLKSSGDLNCSKCGEEFREIKDLQQLSATNPLGACQSCDGHGANLEIDREKVVRDWSLSVHEGAVHVLNYVHFEHFRPCLEREMKKQGFDPRAPFANWMTPSGSS